MSQEVNRSSKERLDRRTVLATIRAAGKKVRILSDRKLEENLDHAVGGDAVEAYRIGVEEAQGEILQRLDALLREAG